MKTTNSTIRIVPGTLFAVAFFVGTFFCGQNSISSFFTVPLAHAQYDDGGYDDGSTYDDGGYDSGYYDDGGSSYDDNSGYYNAGYDPYSYDNNDYSYDDSGYDYGTCSGDCGSYGGYTDYDTYDYGSYGYTTPYYQTSTYYPSTYYPLPHYQTPTINCPSGYTLQDNTCVPPVTNCPSGYTLQDNTCVPPVTNCPSGYTLQNNTCVPPVVQQPVYYQPPVYQVPIVQAPIYQQPITYTPPTPQGPYVSLSQVPYTGLDLGPIGTVIYWTLLVLWCLFCAYLIAVKRIQNRFVSWMKTFLFGTKKPSKTGVVQPSAIAPAAVATPDTNVDDFILKQIHRAKA